MKPNFLIADRANEAGIVTDRTAKTAPRMERAMERTWVKVDGQLECRWVACAR